MPSALKYKPLPKPSPQSDPRYRRVMEQLKQGAKKTKDHVPASKKTADAAKASKGPPNERLAAGKSKQVDKIKEAKEGKPEQSSFLEMLRAEIAKAMPKTLGETENFDSAADGMKSGLKGNVSQQKEKSTQDVSGASKQAPAPAGEAKAGGPLPKDPNPAAPKIDAASGMPEKKTDADISLQASKTDTDQQMKEAEVTPTQLKKANDPRFSAVIDAKQQVAQNADAGPAKYRAKESATLSSAASQATSKAKVSAAMMVGVRGGGNTKVLTKQQQQKAKDEAARAKVTAAIEGIFAATKARVDAKLASIDTEVNSMFDRGTEAALSAMKKFVNGKIRDYKIRRYLSIPLVGLARWVKDQFLNLPDEVNVFYEQGRQLFQAQMDALIVRVAALVELRLKEAKAEVAKGKQQIQDFVDKQPKELQAAAKEAQTKVSADFDSLEQGIDNKKNELASSLAQKYKEGFDKANEALKEIQDSNKGFVAAFAEKLAEVIKAIMEFKARLMAILRKGADTIKLIIADPLGFLGNLISAVKGGIAAFGANIWKHLKAGFMRWLLGNAPPGIEIPSDLSPGSVFKLVLGVLGITYEKMRAKAVKLLGPTAVTVIETLVRYVQALISGGPAKLWAEVQADLANLKEMVIGAFQDYLVTTIVQKAITKIVSMFNPAGAIIQAILAIVSIVQFVVEKAAQIMEFVESVINSVHAIATGSIGGAVKRIEQALANAVPLLIGFLASLLGLSGVSKKIREFVMKVQAKVDAAIDKVLKKIVDTVKKLLGKGGGKDGPDGPVEKITEPVDMKGASHTLTLDVDGMDMASSKGKLSTKIGAAIAKVNKIKPVPKNAKARISSLTAMQAKAKGMEDDRKKDKSAAMTKKLKGRLKTLLNQIKAYAVKYDATDIEAVLAKEFPGPVAGIYGKLGTEDALPDGKIRQDHHAPPVQLAASLAAPIAAAAKVLKKKKNKQGKPVKAAVAAGQVLEDVAADLNAATSSGGGTLPAIRIHEQTHKTAGGPGARVHGSELREDLESMLVDNGPYDLEELTLTSTGNISVRPGESAFDRQLQVLSRQVTKNKKILTKDALLKKAGPIARRMLKIVSDQHLAAVESAVGSSVIDGPAGERTSAVSKLRSLAKTIWGGLLKKLP